VRLRAEVAVAVYVISRRGVMPIGREQLTSVLVFGKMQTTPIELAPVRQGIRLGKNAPQDAVSSPTIALIVIEAMPSRDSEARAVMVEVWFSAGRAGREVRICSAYRRRRASRRTAGPESRRRRMNGLLVMRVHRDAPPRPRPMVTLGSTSTCWRAVRAVPRRTNNQSAWA
jgi:hypothetical protein